MACLLLHNFIHREMAFDPIEAQLDIYGECASTVYDVDVADHVERVEPSEEWSQFRDNLAKMMWANRFRV